MVPGEPGQHPSVWTEPRVGVEVVAGRNHARLGRAVRRNGHEFIDGFTSLSALRVALANANNVPAIDRYATVGISKSAGFRRLGDDRPGERETIRTIEALIYKIGKEDRLAVSPIRSAPILVHACSGIEPGRRHVTRFSGERAAHDYNATSLEWTSF